jgi:hypothetical protein
MLSNCCNLKFLLFENSFFEVDKSAAGSLKLFSYYSDICVKRFNYLNTPFLSYC